MSHETVPFILDMPVLDDETVDAVNTFLWALVTQFESQYFAQLQRHHQKLNASRCDPLEPWKKLTPDPLDSDGGPDEDLNDETPF